jgi:hypothetical protein
MTTNAACRLPFLGPHAGCQRIASYDGAHASANLYSLIETCKANGVDVYRYLITLFQALPLSRRATGCAFRQYSSHASTNKDDVRM